MTGHDQGLKGSWGARRGDRDLDATHGAAGTRAGGASGWRAWPPRRPDQPIFYAVLDEDYAAPIARTGPSRPAAPDTSLGSRAESSSPACAQDGALRSWLAVRGASPHSSAPALHRSSLDVRQPSASRRRVRVRNGPIDPTNCHIRTIKRSRHGLLHF